MTSGFGPTASAGQTPLRHCPPFQIIYVARAQPCTPPTTRPSIAKRVPTRAPSGEQFCSAIIRPTAIFKPLCVLGASNPAGLAAKWLPSSSRARLPPSRRASQLPTAGMTPFRGAWREPQRVSLGREPDARHAGVEKRQRGCGRRCAGALAPAFSVDPCKQSFIISKTKAL